jgi:hypothetical protein
MTGLRYWSVSPPKPMLICLRPFGAGRAQKLRIVVTDSCVMTVAVDVAPPSPP